MKSHTFTHTNIHTQIHTLNRRKNTSCAHLISKPLSTVMAAAGRTLGMYWNW